jgi:[protein-PII] uridylyltransferase
VIKHLAHREDAAWFDMQLASLPASYLRMSPPAQIAHDLEQLRNLEHNEAVAVGRYQADTGTVEYQVGTYEEVTPGIFHKLTGALSSKGLQILSAEIVTLAEGLVFDRFCVRDPDYAGEPSEDRIDSVRRALVQSLTGGRESQPFRRVWRAASDHRAAALTPLPTQVRIDNSTSDRYTILELFTADRMGLLHTITRTLFDLGMSVSVAKIGTHLDQVVDVFYVTDQAGKKVQDEERLREIRQRLLHEIEQLAE